MLQRRFVTMRYFRSALSLQGTRLDQPVPEADAYAVTLFAGSPVEHIANTRSGPRKCILHWLPCLQRGLFTARNKLFTKQMSSFSDWVLPGLHVRVFAAVPVCLRATTDVMCRHAHVRCLRVPANTRIRLKFSARYMQNLHQFQSVLT